MMSPMIGFVVHKQSGDGIDLHVEQALEHIGGEGHIRSRCGVGWLQYEPELIYTYLSLQHGIEMLRVSP